MDRSKTTRRQFLKQAGAGAAALAAGSESLISAMQNRRSIKTDRPNILFICTDYQSGEDGPSLGASFLDMPTLDRLCRNGVLFSRHYSTAPVCQPARCTWLTGQYPHTHGMWGNYEQWIPEDSPVLMKELGKIGYYTVGIGKMHFKPWNRIVGFHRRILADRKANLESDKEYRDDYAGFLARYGLNRWDYLKLQYESNPPHVYDWPFPPECHIDYYVGSQAVKLIESGELDDKYPWFMWVSFNGPHNPWDPPAEFSKPYLEMDLPSPRTYPGELEAKPTANTRARYGYTKEVADYIDRHPDRAAGYIKRIRAGHYGNLTFIDRQLEKILHALEKKNALDDTIIIFTSDHGALLGDHGSFHKGLIYERSARVPFVVHCPVRFKARRTPALTGHVDLMPTILSLAGAPIPHKVEGKDISPILSNKQRSIQDRLMIEISHNVGIIQDRWKMFVYSNGEGELYDLENDPDERRNLYLDPAHAGIKRDLRSQLIAFRVENAPRFEADPPIFPEQKKQYRFRQGDVLRQGEAPFPPAQGGKSVRIQAAIDPLNGRLPEGAFFVCEEKIPAWPDRPPQNGYALYVKDGRPAIGVRLWDEDFVFSSAYKLPSDNVLVEGILRQDGRVILNVNGKAVARGKVSGSLPERPGRREVLAPSIRVGVGHKGGKPIGDYDPETDFEGTICEILLEIEGESRPGIPDGSFV
jgi:arylsulfatase A-like enzyme